MKVQFEFERDTKNTIRFKEVVNGPLDTPRIGTLYISKSSLKELGYTEGAKLEVSISAVK